ncbi:MAG: anti-sigma factor [Thermoleophilaceae bacterium]|nr:anti-sigma factor [Thermoleophilaceae bacterium]
MPRGHEEHQDNVGAYLLGALPELEATAFEKHVMGCADCRDELERLRVSADALARAVPQVVAPGSLKASLMDAVRAEAPVTAVRRFPIRLPRIDLPRIRPAMAWVSAAFLLAVGVLAGYAGSVLTSEDDAGNVRTVAGQVDAARSPNGTATLVIPEGEGDATLRVNGMPKLAKGYLYEVWYSNGSRNTPVGTFTVDADGTGVAALPEGLEGVEQVMVTRERAPGVKAPSPPGPLVTVKT